jgi:Flp pilus assembly protein TadB
MKKNGLFSAYSALSTLHTWKGRKKEREREREREREERKKERKKARQKERKRERERKVLISDMYEHRNEDNSGQEISRKTRLFFTTGLSLPLLP